MGQPRDAVDHRALAGHNGARPPVVRAASLPTQPLIGCYWITRSVRTESVLAFDELAERAGDAALSCGGAYLAESDRALAWGTLPTISEVAEIGRSRRDGLGALR